MNENTHSLEQSRARWRMTAIGCLGLITGAVLAGAAVKAQAPSEVAAVVLQENQSSGRWGATLLAVMENGDIMYLDTSRPQTTWAPFRFSPNFKNNR